MWVVIFECGQSFLYIGGCRVVVVVVVVSGCGVRINMGWRVLTVAH